MNTIPPFGKKQLCMALGFYSPTYRPYTHRLRKEIFTPALMKRLKITEAQYNRMKTFPLHVRKELMRRLELKAEQF